MLGELRRELGLQSQLSEAVQNAPFGTVVGWRTPAGKAYGVVVGKEGKELLCLSAFSKSLAKDKSLTYYEDKSASGKLQQAMPGVLMALQRVPMNRAFKRGRVEGTGLQPYLKAAAHLQLESVEESDMDFEKLNEQLDEINESMQSGAGRQSELTEADEIELTDLPKAQQSLAKVVGLKPITAFHGIHGYVVDFHGRSMGTRFYKDVLQKVIRSKVFRWMECGEDGGVSVGM